MCDVSLQILLSFDGSFNIIDIIQQMAPDDIHVFTLKFTFFFSCEKTDRLSSYVKYIYMTLYICRITETECIIEKCLLNLKKKKQ